MNDELLPLSFDPVSNGEYHNPFRTTGYLDYISTPPYADGANKEPAIRFTATVAPKPAP